MSLSNRGRRLSVAPLAGVERPGRGPLVSGSLAVGISHSLPSHSYFIQGTHPLSGLQSQFHPGQGAGGRSSVFAGQGSDRAGSPSLSRLLQPVIRGDESLRRPVIDLSLLNLKVQKASFKMETLQSVLLLVRAGDWMVSLDLKDAYLQVPMHPESHKFLRFVAGGKVYQFKVLCFGLSSAPQIFTRVMAPVSAFLHRTGIWLRRYLDDWLIQASSREQVLLALETVLQLCKSLGIVVNWEKTRLIPTQRMVYLGVLLDSISFRASPALKRVEKLLSIGDVFLSSVKQPVSSWLELLGVLSSIIQLIPGGRLRMRSLQFTIRRSWDQVDQTALVAWNPEISADLEWWLNRDRLVLGIALDQVSPQLDLWSDASDVGWGEHLGEEVVFGRWAPEELDFSVNARELLAIERALHCFASQIRDSSVAIFADNSTAIVYLRNQGGTRSLLLNAIAQRILRWSETSFDSTIYHGSSQCASGLVISSQSGARVRMNAQDRGIPRAPEEVASVNQSICHLSKSPMFTVFFTVPRSERVGHGCSSPELGWVAGVCLSTLVSDSGSPQEAPIILWGPTDHRSSLLASEAMVSGSSGLGSGRAGGSSSVQRPSSSTALPSSSSGSVRTVTSYLETIQRFARARGFSKQVAQQAALARRPSSRAGYQAKWLVYRQWCHSEGHSVSRPSLSKIADFFFWLHRSRKLSVSAILGYRSMLSAVFRMILPEISTSPIIRDLLRSFQVEAPCRSIKPPSWDLVKVLEYLRSPVCNHTFPEHLISTIPHPRRIHRHTHRPRKTKKLPQQPFQLSPVVRLIIPPPLFSFQDIPLHTHQTPQF